MDQNFHLIEKYFQGKLDNDELQLFNEKLQKDSAFEQEFRDMKLIRDAVKETSRIRALDILQNAEANLTNQETTKINVSMKRLVSIAASLLIVATVSYFAFSGGTGALTGEEIVATYYKTYPNIVETRERGGSIELTTLRARAYNAYDIKDYSTSADLFKDLLASEKIAENYLYSGIANFEAGNFDVAKNNLNSALNNFSDFKEQAQWYLAMTFFAEGSTNEAITNIVQLSVSKSSYKKVADKLLADLNLTIEPYRDEEEGGGAIETTNMVPPNGDTVPDGSLLDLRRYQYGSVRNLANNERYKFINDDPIEDLKAGDLVEFVLIKGKSANEPLAVILAKH